MYDSDQRPLLAMISTLIKYSAFAFTYGTTGGAVIGAPLTRHKIDEAFDVPHFDFIFTRSLAADSVHTKEIILSEEYDDFRRHKFVVYFSRMPPGNIVQYCMPDTNEVFDWTGEIVVFRKKSTDDARTLVNFRKGDYYRALRAIRRSVPRVLAKLQTLIILRYA